MIYQHRLLQGISLPLNRADGEDDGDIFFPKSFVALIIVANFVAINIIHL